MKRGIWLGIIAILLVACAIFTAVGFRGGAGLLPEDMGIPDRELVFILEGTTGSLGFVNADGSAFVSRELDLSRGPLRDFINLSELQPSNWALWSRDGKYLLSSAGHHDRAAGYPLLISTTGEVLMCSDEERAPYGGSRASTVSGTTIITVDEWPNDVPNRVVMVDMNECTREGTLYTAAEGENLDDAAISAMGWLAISRDSAESGPDILIMADTGVAEFVISGGKWPSWSHDGKLLAYTVFREGVHVVNKDGSGDRIVVHDPTIGATSWSPDGNWLVYDRAVEIGGPLAIFKTNIHSGEEIKIFEGGFSPNWRWASP